MERKTDFDNFAENYREIHTQNVQGISGVDSSYFGRQKVEIIKNERGGVEKKNHKIKILDLGCGDGINAVHFKQYFTHMEYFGIDISQASIAQAKNLECSNIHFACYDGKKIPYKDESFHIILAACVLHHVPHEQHENLLLECNRVLKRDGMLYIFEHNPWNPITRKIVNDCVFDADAVLVHRRKLVKVLRRAGFLSIKTAYIIFMPRKGIFNTISGIEKLLKWCPLGGQYYVSAGKK